MCGICGFYSSTPRNRLPMVLQMNAELTHRGPDGCGHFSDGCCSLAMRRLAIIDLAGGDQPISSEDGRYVIVFNGEIYNYQELRQTLRQRGHHFRTNSDTEAIVHLFEDEGPAAVAQLKGMFAFALYDRQEQALLLARDRFGEKPLFYHASGQGFAFSSELRSLLACPLVPRRLDHEALGYYLRTGWVPAPLTLFAEVYALPPGTWLRLHAGQVTIEPYYQIAFRADHRLAQAATAAEQVRAALQQAVRRQAMSEVPLGAFLSGGIDSSAVTAMLQKSQDRPSKSLTIRFQDAAYDDSQVARQIADRLGTDHAEFVVPNLAFEEEDLWRIVEHVGLPLADSSAIPTYRLCQQARRAVTVALSGDGGDELFAGYAYFRWGLALARLRRAPRAVLQPAAALLNGLARTWPAGRVGALRQARRALEASLAPAALLPVHLDALFSPAEAALLVAEAPAAEAVLGDLPRVTALPDEAAEWSPLRRLMYYRLKHVLPARMLVKMDRMSMANSLEVRAPMLDPDLADLSMRLPDDLLLRHGAGKHVLREAIRPDVPEVVLRQPKAGFSLPLHRFQNQAYKALAERLLLNGEAITHLFHKATLRRLIEVGTARQHDRADLSVYRASHQLWSLMQLAAWAQRFRVQV